MFGALMIWSPGAGALAVVWVIAAYSIFYGILLVALGFRLRGLARATPAMPGSGRNNSARLIA